MAPMKLFYSPGACSLASHVLLREVGADFELVKIAFKSPELLAINPKLRVPVLAIDGIIITETPAIFTFISQLAPEEHLLGKSNLEVVRTYEWLNWLSGTLHGQGFGGSLRPERYIDDSNHFPGIRAKGWTTVKECFAKIESQLNGLHAVGDSFTVVDVFLYIFYRWGSSRGEDMKGQYPRYSDLVFNLAGRESVKQALLAEGLKTFIPKL